MELLKNSYYVIALAICSFNLSIAQKRDYAIDSLQIKVYTEIEYVNSHSKNIKVKKVFCDYCSKNQIKFLKERAKQLAYYDRYNPKERMVNGMRKFAIIIRVSKKDFIAIKEDK
jgi:hypothetical protein